MINIPEIKQAVTILRQGGLVAFPTETVYGLGADAANAEAVRQVFLAKGRPLMHPLIVHIASQQEIHAWADAVPAVALKLAEAFWPGPLTMVFKKQAHVLDVVTGGQATVALRVPNHPIALALLTEFGAGVVAPSANQFTHVSPTTAAAVSEELAHVVGMILDGGHCAVGVESTILDMSREWPCILRPGMISADAIAAVLGHKVLIKADDDVRVPGQHQVHYAPMTKTVVMTTEELLDACHPGNAILGYSDEIRALQQSHVVMLSKTPEQYAHDLYHQLRELDHLGVKQILIEKVPEGRAWDAIRDRLMKASGGRE